jgi:helix-turn-helix protein
MKKKKPYSLKADAFKKPAGDASGTNEPPENAGAPPHDNLLDRQDMLQVLKVCPKTLQRYRAKGYLVFTKVGGKILYSENAFNEMVQKGFLKNKRLGKKKKKLPPKKK